MLKRSSLDFILKNNIGKAFNLQDFIKLKEHDDLIEENAPSATVVIDDIYRQRLDSTFSHSMPSVIVKKRNNTSALETFLDEEDVKILAQVCCFPDRVTWGVVRGPWLSLSLDASSNVSSETGLNYYSISVDCQSIYRENKMVQFTRMVNRSTIEIIWSKARIASWPSGVERLSNPVVVRATFKTASSGVHEIDVLIATIDKPSRLIASSTKTTIRDAIFSINQSLTTSLKEEVSYYSDEF